MIWADRVGVVLFGVMALVLTAMDSWREPGAALTVAVCLAVAIWLFLRGVDWVLTGRIRRAPPFISAAAPRPPWRG